MAKYILTIILGMILITATAIVSHYTGSVAIRSVPNPLELVTLHLTEPVTPGTPVTISWQKNPDTPDRTAEAVVRSPNLEHVLGQAPFSQERLVVTFPCNGPTQANLILRDANNLELLAQREVTISPPSIDCALHQ